ncbi:MAG TPA: hypothetical protein VEY11_16880 [Pyrinomonadaceae bacterium]|nr:hypothetical protein [Pyrinomonadaceae bacterium]
MANPPQVPPTVMYRDPRRLDDIKQTVTTAARIGVILSRKKDREKRKQRFLRAINFIVGGIVGLLSLLALTSPYKEKFGSNLPTLLSLFASLVLLLDAALPLIVEEPNPQRYKDYYFYIQRYARLLSELALDTEIDEQVWNARVRELIAQAKLNIDDVFGEWTWVVDEMEKRGWASHLLSEEATSTSSSMTTKNP